MTTSAQQNTEAPANTCQLHADATLALTESAGRYLVNVGINGVERLLIVDTSAEKSALTPEAADALELPRDMSKAENIRGVGTDLAPEYPRIVASLKLGPQQWSNLRVPTLGTHSIMASDGVQPAGVLGANVLSRYDVELDFPRHTMTLYSTQNCLGQFAPWHGSYQSYSPFYTPTHRFVMQMALNRHPIQAILDTGAMPSLVNRDAASRAGVDANTLLQDPLHTGHGVNGTAFSVYLHRFDTMRIGTREFQDVKLEVGDAPFAADMLLGMDFLKWRRVWLSYSTGWVFMQLAADRDGSGTASAPSETVPNPTASVWAHSLSAAAPVRTLDDDTATPTPIARFSSHSHMTYQQMPRIVQQSRLQPPPTGMAPLNSAVPFMGP